MQSPRGSFQDFVQELKRRRVFRAGAWYAGASFVVLQAADLVLPALGASGWWLSALVVAALLGFPVALALAWAFDVTAAGVRRAPIDGGASADPVAPAAAQGSEAAPDPAPAPAPPSSTRAARRSGGWARGAIAAVVLIAAGLSGWTLYHRATGPVTAESVAVMPFTVRGSTQQYLREGMVELLSRSLDGAGSLRSVDPATVLLTVEREHQAGAVDAATGRRLARSLGAGWFVTGSILEAGPSVRVQAALYRQSDEEDTPPAHTAQAEGPADSVFALADRVAAELLVARGGLQGRRLAEAAAVTTSSLDALKAYLSAEEHLRSAEFDSALASYRRATDADSTFALAYYRLAVAGVWANTGESVTDSALARAQAVRGRLAQRDRRLLDAFVAFNEGRAKESEAQYRSILRDYPDDLEATFQLADLLYHFSRVQGRPLAESYDLFRKVLELDPQFLCPI